LWGRKKKKNSPVSKGTRLNGKKKDCGETTGKASLHKKIEGKEGAERRTKRRGSKSWEFPYMLRGEGAKKVAERERGKR